MSDNGVTGGLYQKYRPKKLADVVGQDSAVKVLEGLFKGGTFPRAILFHGPPGTGKTTLGRILRKKLGCKDGDFYELNSANFRGIDSAREVDSRMRMRPMSQGSCRIWMFDEVHRWTGDAQEAMLKPLEEAPAHVHFFLCTTEPDKLKKAVRSRCTEVGLKAVNGKLIGELCASVAEAEGFQGFPEEVRDRIADAADGSPRKALTLLESVLSLDSEQEMIDAIERADHKAEAIKLAQALISPRVTWPEIAKILRGLEEDSESLRRMVLGYCQAILLSEKPNPGIMPRAYLVLSYFRYDTYASGKPGLTAACWEVVNAGKK